MKCNSCEEEKQEDDFGKYTDNRTGKIRTRKECKSCRVKREDLRSKENRERSNSYKTKYKNNNKDKVRESENIRVKLKRVNDPQYNIKESLVKKTREHLIQDKWVNIIGCTSKQFRTWFEYCFTTDINWDTLDNWECDHVIPLSYFDLNNDNEYKLASHWTNIRPLLSKENKIKGNKILPIVIKNHISQVIKFLSINTHYQTSMETCWWQREKLWYGKNEQIEEDFEDLLKRTIRSQAS